MACLMIKILDLKMTSLKIQWQECFNFISRHFCKLLNRNGILLSTLDKSVLDRYLTTKISRKPSDTNNCDFLKHYQILYMESYFHSIYSNLVTESQKDTRSSDFWEEKSHIQSVAGWRTSLCVCGFLSRIWQESTRKTLKLMWPLKHDLVSKFGYAVTKVFLAWSIKEKLS